MDRFSNFKKVKWLEFQDLSIELSFHTPLHTTVKNVILTFCLPIITVVYCFLPDCATGMENSEFQKVKKSKKMSNKRKVYQKSQKVCQKIKKLVKQLKKVVKQVKQLVKKVKQFVKQMKQLSNKSKSWSKKSKSWSKNHG